MKAARAITHSGDECTGAKEGIDEMVWVGLRKLPANVELLIFVVAAYSGGNLMDVVNGKLHLLEERQNKEIGTFEMERSRGQVDVVAVMFKDRGEWTFRTIDEPAQQGQHFMDILPLLSDVVRVFIPSAPKRQKVAFAMEKGAVLDLPQQLDVITVGLGWDTDDGACDLDVSAVLLRDNVEIETVFFGNLESIKHGITHSGDNLTGEGDGDDEQIICNLLSIGPEVNQVVFVINVYEKNFTFENVSEPYCRVFDNATQSELCRYELRDAGNQKGLIIGKLRREAGDRWGFHAMGIPCKGRTYKDSLPEIIRSATLETKSLKVGSSTSGCLGNKQAPFSSRL